MTRRLPANYVGLICALLLLALRPTDVLGQVSALGAPVTSTETSGSQSGKAMTFTVPAGNHRLLVVTTGGGGNSATVESVTFGGIPLTQGVTTAIGGNRSSIWHLVMGSSPIAATANVEVKHSATFSFSVTAMALQGVDQTTPVSSAVSNDAPGLTVASAVNDLVIDAIVGNGAEVAVGAGQTLRANSHNLGAGGDPDTGTSTKLGAATVRLDWTGFTSAIAHVALNVRQVPASPVAITTATLPNATIHTTDYLGIVTATGGSGAKTFAVTTGALPPGLTLSAAGTLSGACATAGRFTFTITATDATGGTGAREFTVVVAGPPTVEAPTVLLPSEYPLNLIPYLNPALSPIVTLGGTVVASNGAAVLDYGILVAPTAVNAAPVSGGIGVIARPAGNNGTDVFGVSVTGLTAGTAYTYRAYATNSTGVGYSPLGTFTMPNIVSRIGLPPAVRNRIGYSHTLTVPRGEDAMNSYVTAGTLPPGLSLSGGIVRGTPTHAGASLFTVQFYLRSGGFVDQAYALEVLDAGTQLTIPTYTLPNAGLNVAGYSQSIVATGGTGATTFSLTFGTLPPGLTLTPGGTISGTATKAGIYLFTVAATDSLGSSANRVLSITVASHEPVVLSTTTLPNAIIGGGPYSASVEAKGGTGLHTLVVTAGAIPPNVAFINKLLYSPSSGLGGFISGTFSGVPSRAGTYNFTITATDALGVSGSRSYTIVVNPATSAFAITTPSLPSAAVGVSYYQTIAASGGSGLYSFAISDGRLPPGLTLESGAIGGTPTAAALGTHSFTVTATDSFGASTSRILAIGVNPPPLATQTITFASLPNKVASDAPFTLAASANSGQPVVFTVSGPATISGHTLALTGSPGLVTVTAARAATGLFAAAADVVRTFTVTAADRLINLSSRVRLAPDPSRALIAGFVIGGTQAKRVLVRAIGPALADFGVAGAVVNPRLQIFDSAGRFVLENDDWSGAATTAAFAQVGAFVLPVGSRDAALLATLAPGAYTMQVTAGIETGIALAEVYDASANPGAETQRLVNLSTRGMVEAGEGMLIGGFVIQGDHAKRVLIRGIGPRLALFGVPGALSDPRLAVYRGQTMVAQNDNWSTPSPVNAAPIPATAAELAAVAEAVGAFALGAGSLDAAVLVTLPPGAYTAQVSGAGTSTGVALVEIYEVP